jgi:filamentous hemagglutinin family protein
MSVRFCQLLRFFSHPRVWTILAGFTFSGLGAGISQGQVVLDSTLRSPRTDLSGDAPSFGVNDSMGLVKGRNLFHSFEQLDLKAGDRLTFSGRAGLKIDNVLVRVTGRRRSRIDGAIRFDRTTIPDANLFMINPAGFLFGPGSSIDIPGALAVTTADYVRLGNTGTFHASRPQRSLLTSSAPSAFGFLGSAPAQVRIDGPAEPGTFAVEGKHSLSIVAGSISIRNRTLLAKGGKVSLVTENSPGREVQLEKTSPAPVTVRQPQPGQGEISISKGTISATDGGSILVRGAPLRLTDSSLRASTFGPTSGGVDVASIGDIDIVRSRIDTSTVGEGNAGALRLHGARITIRGGGDGPDGTTAALAASSGVFTTPVDQAGAGGNILIEASSLAMLDADAVAIAGVGANSRGGNIEVICSGPIVLDTNGGDGAAGFTVETLQRDDGVETFGDAGRISLTASALTIRNKARLATATATAGNAGSIFVNVDALRIDGEDASVFTGIDARVGDQQAPTHATGRGGSVFVSAHSIALLRGGVISATTYTSGNAGQLRVRARTIDISGPATPIPTGLFARTIVGGDGAAGAGGRGGNIDLRAREIRLHDGGQIAVTSTTKGRAGDIHISGANELTLVSSASIRAEAKSSQGGNITIAARDLVRLDHAQITAFSGGADGAHITIDPRAVTLSASEINGKAAGRDVFVQIDARALLLSSDSTIETDFADFTPTADVTRGLATLESAVRDAAAVLQATCAKRYEGSFSSFVVTSRGGLPLEPAMYVPSLTMPHDDVHE